MCTYLKINSVHFPSIGMWIGIRRRSLQTEIAFGIPVCFPKAFDSDEILPKYQELWIVFGRNFRHFDPLWLSFEHPIISIPQCKMGENTPTLKRRWSWQAQCDKHTVTFSKNKGCASRGCIVTPSVKELPAIPLLPALETITRQFGSDHHRRKEKIVSECLGIGPDEDK